MGNYNFENDNKDFGETRRLDTINKEVRRIEKNLEAKKRSDDDLKEATVFGMNKKLAAAVIILCVIFIVGGCFVLSKMMDFGKETNGGNENGASLQNGEGIGVSDSNDDLDCAVLVGKSSKSITVVSAYTGKTAEAEISNSTIITGANGGKISFSDLQKGDVLKIVFSKDGTAGEIRFPQEVWSIESALGIDIDTEKMTVSFDNKEFSFDDETVFTYKGQDIYPGDIEKSDIVTLFGTDGRLLSARVEKCHGYIVFKNAENIEDISVKIDFGEAFVPEKSIIPASEGKHTVLVSGSNIDDYMAEIEIKENENTEIDLADTADAIRITFNVNANTYKLFINGIEYPENTMEIAVSRGEYEIKVTSDGYKDFTAVADCTKEDVTMDIKLEKTAQSSTNFSQSTAQNQSGQNGAPKTQGSLTVYTEPGWAKIYVDGKYIGVAPVMVKLDYGSHSVEAKNDSGDVERKDVNIDSPDKTIKLEF